MSEIKTMVAILGCHLEAELKGKNWEEIVFGEGGIDNPDLSGRVVMGLRAVLQYRARFLSFGTGASFTGPLSEAVHTKRSACLAQSKITDSLDLNGMEEFAIIESALMRAEVDDTSVNTNQEVASAIKFCLENNVDRLIIVSSAWHIIRAYKIALDYRHSLLDYYIENLDIVPVAAAGSTEDTHVSEPPHRGDRPKVPAHRFTKRFDSLCRNSQTAEGFIEEVLPSIEKWEDIKRR